MTPPATDTATLAPAGIAPMTLVGILAGLALLTLVLLAVPAELRRRR